MSVQDLLIVGVRVEVVWHTDYVGQRGRIIRLLSLGRNYHDLYDVDLDDIPMPYGFRAYELRPLHPLESLAEVAE